MVAHFRKNIQCKLQDSRTTAKTYASLFLKGGGWVVTSHPLYRHGRICFHLGAECAKADKGNNVNISWIIRKYVSDVEELLVDVNIVYGNIIRFRSRGM